MPALPTMSQLQTKLTDKIQTWFIHGFLLVTILAVYVPFTPDLPTNGLDPSWQIGINQAAAQGLAFGRDMIFTFGPYSFVFSEVYHPATGTAMLLCCVYLAVIFGACIVPLKKNVRDVWVLALCVFLAGMIYPRDALLFLIPLVVALAAFQRYFSQESVQRSATSTTGSQVGWLVLLLSPLGLLPLVKGSLIVLCVAVPLLCFVSFLWKNEKIMAAICLVVPVLSALTFWILIGQSPTTIPDHLINLGQIIAGYTEAMALQGSLEHTFLYLLNAALLLIVVIYYSTDRFKKIYLGSLYSVFLFITFKAGFVRQDIHVFIAADSLCIAALMLPFIFNNLSGKLVGVLAVLTVLVTANLFERSGDIAHQFVIEQFTATYLSAWEGIINRATIHDWPLSDYQARIASLRESAGFPPMRGTTDIYSFDQVDLIATGLRWSPRPILQSYSAYTPVLAEINRSHLLGAEAPDNIIFKVQPIDGRLPALMDGASWPQLLLNYHVTASRNDELFLKKNASAYPAAERLPLKAEAHQFGEVVRVPAGTQPVFAELTIQPTWVGRLANLLYKPNQLFIQITTEDGRVGVYRLIAGMAKSPFLISPFIGTTKDFKLMSEKADESKMNTVKSFMVISPNDTPTQWKRDYLVSFSQLNQQQ